MLRNALAWLFVLLELAAAVEFTNPASFFAAGITAGSPVTITWTGASGPVTLLLKNGAATDLQTVETIISGATGTSYIWTPPLSLSTGLYALEIEDSTAIPNYSEQFTITGSAAATTSNSAHPSQTSSAGSTSSSSAPSTTSTSHSSTSSPSSSSSFSTTSPGTSISQSTTSTSTSTPQPSHGLSTGAKAGIGVGAALGALLFIAIVFFAFWYGRRSAGKNKKSTPDEEPGRKAELEAVEARRKAELETTANIAEMRGPLSDEEKQELERRRRAAELEGSSPVPPGVVSERAELEARRRGAREVFEMS